MSVRPVPTYQQRISGRLVPAFINSLGYWSDRSCFQFSDSCPLRPILQAACILFLRAFCIFSCAFILAHFQCIFKFFLEILFRFYMQSLKKLCCCRHNPRMSQVCIFACFFMLRAFTYYAILWLFFQIFYFQKRRRAFRITMSNFVGSIVYENDWQIAVQVDDGKRI